MPVSVIASVKRWLAVSVLMVSALVVVGNSFAQTSTTNSSTAYSRQPCNIHASIARDSFSKDISEIPCQTGQRILFHHSSQASSKASVYMVAILCDIRYPAIREDRLIACIYSPVDNILEASEELGLRVFILSEQSY